MKSANTFYNETCLKWKGLISEDAIDVLINSRLLNRCHNGLITKNELDGFLAQQYFYSRHFVQYLCSLISNLNSYEDVRKLLDNLYEEMGLIGDQKMSHAVMFQEMLNSLKVNINCYSELESTTELIKVMFNYCRNSDPAIGLAALCLGAEAIVPLLYSRILEGFTYQGYNLAYLKFFTIHIEEDDKHSTTMKYIIDKIILNYPEKQRVVRAVGDEMIFKRTLFLDSISNKYHKGV